MSSGQSHHIARAARSRWLAALMRSSRGQAFIETAIGVTLILGMTWAVVDAGGLFWTYLTLENAVTEAARYAGTQQTMTGLSRADSIRSQLRYLAPGITIPDGEISFYNITTNSNDAGTFNELIRVSVDHTHSPFLPLPMFLNSAHRNFRIKVSSIVRNEPAP